MTKRSATPQDVHEGYFDPSFMQLLERVVEEALEELARRESGLADPTRIALTRELLAHRVMARAARGEREPDRLREHALWGF